MAIHQFTQLERHARAEARVGTSLCNKWRIERLLGSGGMASVFAATHYNGSRVAIKMLHAELSDSVDLRERFLAEAYAANKVGPPGVVSVLDEGKAEDGSPFLVMELLEGQTLEERCTIEGLLDSDEALIVADQILAVLERAHQKGIVHRDIKPDNVFITRSGEVRLLDFGIARMNESHRTHPTEIGAAMGTPAFMPPEQARGRWEAVDGRSDLWSLGATLFWAVSGQFVHEAPTVNEELLLAMTEPARSLVNVSPHSPRELVELIDRALAFSPNDRFPSATAMRDAVGEARARLQFERATTLLAPALPPRRTSESPASSGRSASMRPWIATLRVPLLRRPTAVLALALAGFGAIAAGTIDWLVGDRASTISFPESVPQQPAAALAPPAPVPHIPPAAPSSASSPAVTDDAPPPPAEPPTVAEPATTKAPARPRPAAPRSVTNRSNAARAKSAQSRFWASTKAAPTAEPKRGPTPRASAGASPSATPKPELSKGSPPTSARPKAPTRVDPLSRRK